MINQKELSIKLNIQIINKFTGNILNNYCTQKHYACIWTQHGKSKRAYYNTYNLGVYAFAFGYFLQI